jgi:hypothetical protein
VEPREIVLLATVALMTVYLVGIGGATAAAIRIGESWRRRQATPPALNPLAEGEIVLEAPTLPLAARRLRQAGWIAFPFAVILGVFGNLTFPWAAPAVVVLTVGLNAFYFTAMQSLGEPLALHKDGFRTGVGKKARSVRWVHVTDLAGARLGAFSGVRMSEEGEWQDPRLKPNVIFFRLNRALVHSPKTFGQRLSGLGYYDGVIRNAFGVSTESLVQAMREWQRLAIAAEAPPMRRRAR